MDSGFIHVSSSACTDIYAGNTGSDFKNLLYKKLSLHYGYEVGLAEIQFYPNHKVLSESIKDNTITVTIGDPLSIPIYIPNLYENLNNLIAAISVALSALRLEVDLSLFENNEGKSRLLFLNKSKAYDFILDEYLQLMLGFKEPILGLGDTESQYDIDPILFETFKHIERFQIIRTRILSVAKIIVKEPEDRTLEGLETCINEGIEKLPNLIDKLSFNAEGKTLEVSSTLQFKLNIQLPFVMQKIFKIDLITLEPNSSAKFSNINMIKMIDPRCLILCNIIKNQFYKNQHLPILRTIQISDEEVFKCIFDKIHYLPLNSTDIENIHIQILRHDLQPLSVSTRPSFVTLAYRPSRV